MARRFTGIGLRTAETGLALLFAAVAALAIADALDMDASRAIRDVRSKYRA